MPIVNRPVNNRLIPTNSRAVDVARDSIDRITGHQARRYDNAFQVQGFQSVLYNKLKCGIKCMCTTKESKVPKSLLDENGNAGPGVINKLLTGQQFGVTPYGSVPSKVSYAPMTGGGFGGGVVMTDDEEGIYDRNEPKITKPFYGSPGTGFVEEDDLEVSNTDVILEDGFSDNGPVSGEGTIANDLFNQVLGSEMEMGFEASSDVACPICFGTGYVGGFSLYNGCRMVLDSQVLDSRASGDALKNLEPFVPTMQGTNIVFMPVTLPRGVVGVDVLNVWNNTDIIPARIKIDGTLLNSERNLAQFCDGRTHTFSVEFDKETTITHLEIQYNQSDKKTLFEFPKLSQNSVETLLENTESFQITMSPVIPNVTSGDIITETTYGKVFQVTTSNWWNDKRRAVLGWDCGVRACQPQELYTLLPHRRALESQNTPSFARPNTDKRY